MITCKKLDPYLKISTRYWHLKIGSKWDYVIPWPMKIAVTRSIFEIEVSNFGFSSLFVCSTNAILQLRLYDQFLKKSFFFKLVVEPRGLNPKYEQNRASYGDFHRSRYDIISFAPNFQMSISRWNFEIWVWFFAFDDNFYRFQNNF